MDKTAHQSGEPGDAHESPEFIDAIPLGPLGRSQGRTLSDGECGVLTSLTWTTGDIHANIEYARAHEFGGIILGGPVMVAVASGLFGSSDFYRAFLQNHHLRVVAAVGMDVSYAKPFLFGDTMWVASAVEQARASRSRPGSAVVTFADTVVNQREERIADIRRTLLVTRA